MILRVIGMVYQISAGLLITCFYAAFFYKQISLRRKGIHANRMGKGTKPSRTAQIEKSLMAATFGSAVGQYASVFLGTYLYPFKLPGFMHIAGIVISFLGIIFFIQAITDIKDSWRAGIDESQHTGIVTKGIYQFSRNPAFLGFDCLYIGISLTIPNTILFILMVVTIGLLHMQILEEEKFLPKVFGEEYIDYKLTTPRYLFIGGKHPKA